MSLLAAPPAHTRVGGLLAEASKGARQGSEIAAERQARSARAAAAEAAAGAPLAERDALLEEGEARAREIIAAARSVEADGGAEVTGARQRHEDGPRLVRLPNGIVQRIDELAIDHDRVARMVREGKELAGELRTDGVPDDHRRRPCPLGAALVEAAGADGLEDVGRLLRAPGDAVLLSSLDMTRGEAVAQLWRAIPFTVQSAARRGRLALVRLLVEGEAALYAWGGRGDSALHAVADPLHVAALVDAGEPAGVPGEGGRTPLHAAASRARDGGLAAAAALLEGGAPVDAPDDAGSRTVREARVR